MLYLNNNQYNKMYIFTFVVGFFIGFYYTYKFLQLTFYDVLDYKCTYRYLETDVGQKRFKLYRTIKKFLIDKNINKKEDYVCVSLSLGVDSAVVCYILCHLGYKVLALHINPNCRRESKREELFIIKWCKENFIKLEIMEITDLDRDKMNKKIYNYTRTQRRYNFYKKNIEKYNLKGIILGHHSGDIVENIFTNAMKGKCVKDLGVMKHESILHGVKIWRPMLDFSKEAIYKFAYKYNIPYFKDTTPYWSNRGIMRRILFPQLEKQYGKTFKRNLLKLGEESNQLWNYFNETKLTPFFDNNVVYDYNKIIIKEINETKEFFWKTTLLKIMHDNNQRMISVKVFNIFMNNIKNRKTCSITFRKDIKCIMNFEENNIIIYYNVGTTEVT